MSVINVIHAMRPGISTKMYIIMSYLRVVPLVVRSTLAVLSRI